MHTESVGDFLDCERRGCTMFPLVNASIRSPRCCTARRQVPALDLLELNNPLKHLLQPHHNFSLNLIYKLWAVAKTSPFPSSKTPLSQTFLPSVFSIQLRHSTTPGIGIGFSYLIVNSAVTQPVIHCVNTGVPNVSSSKVTMRPPWAKFLNGNLFKH